MTALRLRALLRVGAIVVASASSAFGQTAKGATTKPTGAKATATLSGAPKATATKSTKKPASSKPVLRKTPSKAPSRAPAWLQSEGPAELAEHLRSNLSARTRSGEWGAVVVSLTTGDTLFEHNPDEQMAPASTMKMYTSAVALDRFGPDYTFATPVLRDAAVSADGTLNGNLYLRGVGDPSLSTRFWKGDTPMDALARQVVQAGIKRIRGDIVGDATAFESRLIPDGWKTSYLGASYAARVSALSLNENLVWVVVKPNGTTASVTLEPATTTIPVQSTVRLTSGSGGSISASRRPDGSIVVKGSIGSRSAPRKYSLVVDDPALFTTGALRAALQSAGVIIDGSTRMGPTPETAATIGSVVSPPLGQIVGEMNRESINIVAELLFRSAAATSSQVGSAETGLATLHQFFTDKVHADGGLIAVSDGSGLSELDRVTARSMVELLGYAHASAWSAVFHASLPVEGESGTLRNHKGTPARGNLHAKTGTTNTVASLGGFVTARNGEVLAFSFIYNGGDRWNAKATMDTMGATLAEFTRER